MKRKKQSAKNQLTSRSSLSHQKQIDIKNIDLPINECPIVVPDNKYPFTFSFVGSCPSTQCQYHSEVTSRKCLVLDMKMPSNGFTDREIHYFKIENSKTIPEEQKPQIRTVNLMRKKAQLTIKSNIVFYYYLSWIRENKEPEDTPFVYKKGSKKFLESIITEYPFVQEGVDFFEYWMLPFLFDADLYSEFCKSNEMLQIQSSDINLQSVLNLTPVKFSKTHLLIKELADPRYQKVISRTL